jgi:quercetin dioxygenase-like cupin family protein
MTTGTPPDGALPPDDPARHGVHVNLDTPGLRHISLVGDTYTILVSGEDTADAYTLIDMLVPSGGGPPPHRHDFEEMFAVLEGEVEVELRGATSIARTGDVINVPANAPHLFVNRNPEPARLLCMCTPAGQDRFFALIGDEVPSRTSPPKLDPEELTQRRQRALELAPSFRSEFLL